MASGVRHSAPPPKPTSLVTFLFGDKKVTPLQALTILSCFVPCNISQTVTKPYESKLLGVTNYYSWHMREKPIFMCYRLPQWLALHVPPAGDFFMPKTG